MFSKPKLSTVVTIPPPTELQRALQVALKDYGEAKRFKDSVQNKVIDPKIKNFWSYIYIHSTCKVVSSSDSDSGVLLRIVCAVCGSCVPTYLKLSKAGLEGFILTRFHEHIRAEHTHQTIVTRRGTREEVVVDSPHHFTRAWKKSQTDASSPARIQPE